MVPEAGKFILRFAPRHNRTSATVIDIVTLFKYSRDLLLWTKALIDEDEFLVAPCKRVHEGPGFRIPDDSGFQPSGFRIPAF